MRFGGDEFAMLLHEADLPAAVAVCERLRAGTELFDWRTLHPDLAVTLSIGVAASDEARTQEAVLALADQRLYRAKQDGRNRIGAD